MNFTEYTTKVFSNIANNIEDSVNKGYSLRKSFLYTSHIPLILSVIRSFSHKNIIEFGSGMFSTKIFYDNFTNKFTTIESNEDWLISIKDIFKDKIGFDMSYNDISKMGIDSKCSYDQLSSQQIDEISDFYNSQTKKCKVFDVAFIDQEKCSRFISLKCLLGKSKIILYHDSQLTEKFNYGIVEKMYKTDRYSVYKYKTIPNWTNMIVDKKFIRIPDTFKKNLKKIEQNYLQYMYDRFHDLEKEVVIGKFRFRKVDFVNDR